MVTTSNNLWCLRDWNILEKGIKCSDLDFKHRACQFKLLKDQFLFSKWQVKGLHISPKILPRRKSKNLKGKRGQIDSSCWIFPFHAILQREVLSLFNIPNSMPAISCTASLLWGLVRKREKFERNTWILPDMNRTVMQIRI